MSANDTKSWRTGLRWLSETGPNEYGFGVPTTHGEVIVSFRAKEGMSDEEARALQSMLESVPALKAELAEAKRDLHAELLGSDASHRLLDELGNFQAQAEIRVAELEAALAAFTECPYSIDEASIPKAGIDTAPEWVVGTMSVSLAKVRKARALLGLVSDGRGRWDSPVANSPEIPDGSPEEAPCGNCGQDEETHPTLCDEDESKETS